MRCWLIIWKAALWCSGGYGTRMLYKERFLSFSPWYFQEKKTVLPAGLRYELATRSLKAPLLCDFTFLLSWFLAPGGKGKLQVGSVLTSVLKPQVHDMENRNINRSLAILMWLASWLLVECFSHGKTSWIEINHGVKDLCFFFLSVVKKKGQMTTN